MSNYRKFKNFIETIDNSQAKCDGGRHGTLAAHIEASATCNAGDTLAEKDAIPEHWFDHEQAYYELALHNAEMIYNCWQDFYPNLIK